MSPSSLLQEINRVESDDGSLKVLWKLHDGNTIESVVLPRALKQRKQIPIFSDSTGQPESIGRNTVCVSSQVGCAMACDFCLTGKQGLIRNLTHSEILAQVDELKKIRPITNIVFMGMGEPLHNLSEVLLAIEALKKSRSFSRRKILVSTSGLVPALDALANTGVRLAISLNATTDEVRNQIMPVNRKYPIAELIGAAKKYAQTVRQTVMLEYVLLAGLNDSLEDQERLFELAQGWDCKVNLIPFNSFSVNLPSGILNAPYVRPAPDRVKQFQHSLVSRGITATVRYSGGDDVSAACGQLQSQGATARAKRGFLPVDANK